MITVMFRCVGKAGKESKDGVIWTIALERGSLTAKFKTMESSVAAAYIVTNDYPIQIKEDYELAGRALEVTAVSPITGEVLDF